MPQVDELIKLSNRFFTDHWNSKEFQPPEWKEWNFCGSIPNGDLPGCYALCYDNRVKYVGIGIRKGAGIYQNCGLGYRLHKYWRVLNSKAQPVLYKPSPAFEGKIDKIMTIGFQMYPYLAAALEVYLISNLKPDMNVIYNFKELDN